MQLGSLFESPNASFHEIGERNSTGERVRDKTVGVGPRFKIKALSGLIIWIL
jgi:hypothetical protein